MASKVSRRLRLLMLAGSLAGLLVLTLVPSWAPFLSRLEHQTADWRTSLLSKRVAEVHPDVAVVLITEETLRDSPYLLPPDRGLVAAIVRAVDAAGAKAIGLDFYFSRKTEPVKDQALAIALREVRAPVVLGALDERGRLTPQQWAVQRDFIAESAREAGFINLRTEPDGIVRFRAEAEPGSIFPESFAARLAAAAGASGAPVEDPISWIKSAAGRSAPFLTLDGAAVVPGSDERAKAEAAGDIARLAGKTVLIGGDIAYLDRHATPISGKGSRAVPGVFVHAQDVAQRLDGRPLHELSTSAVRWLLLGVAAVAAVLGWSFGVRHFNLMGWTAATAVLVAVDALVFSQMQTILPFSLVLGAWVLGATAGRSARLVMAGANNNERLVT